MKGTPSRQRGKCSGQKETFHQASVLRQSESGKLSSHTAHLIWHDHLRGATVVRLLTRLESSPPGINCNIPLSPIAG